MTILSLTSIALGGALIGYCAARLQALAGAPTRDDNTVVAAPARVAVVEWDPTPAPAIARVYTAPVRALPIWAK